MTTVSHTPKDTRIIVNIPSDQLSTTEIGATVTLPDGRSGVVVWWADLTTTAVQVKDEWAESFVAAEDAPIGVQLWPTTAPGYAHHWTLVSVEVISQKVRDASGTYENTQVVWTYEDGKQRRFE